MIFNCTIRRIQQGRSTEIAWWVVSEITCNHKKEQKFCDTHPGRISLFNESRHKGADRTLELSMEYQNSPEKTAAILLSASLFSRMGTRNRYPANWPPYLTIKVVADMAFEQWDGYVYSWHPSCTFVLPKINDDFNNDEIDSLHALICYLAEEHASLLLTYRPIAKKFVSERDPFIEAALTKNSKSGNKAKRDTKRVWKQVILLKRKGLKS